MGKKIKRILLGKAVIISNACIVFNNCQSQQQLQSQIQVHQVWRRHRCKISILKESLFSMQLPQKDQKNSR